MEDDDSMQLFCNQGFHVTICGVMGAYLHICNRNCGIGIGTIDNVYSEENGIAGARCTWFAILVQRLFGTAEGYILKGRKVDKI